MNLAVGTITRAFCFKVGPHNLDVLSFITGLLLGDGYAEIRSGSTRITVHSSSRNVSYLV
jgi:hypothetical protein